MPTLSHVLFHCAYGIHRTYPHYMGMVFSLAVLCFYYSPASSCYVQVLARSLK
jgi:hypothetical protein